jgi:hypothetical protein
VQVAVALRHEVLQIGSNPAAPMREAALERVSSLYTADRRVGAVDRDCCGSP